MPVLVAGFGGLVAGWAPAHNCFHLVRDWHQHVGLGPALEIMARQCLLAENIPLVAATLQYGRSVPELYEHYEENTVQHKLMRETADLPGVHAFYAEAGMGKSTVAAAVLQELQQQAVPGAFVTFRTPGKLDAEVATTLQSTANQLSNHLTGALERLKKKDFSKVVLVLDALDEHDMTDSDTETIKLLSGVSWELLHRGLYFSVICLIWKWETKLRFEQMNGGHKITGGLAEEACPPVDSSTLQHYASHLQVTTDHYKKWTDKAPYLVVVKRFAEGKYNISKVVERYQEVCKEATDRFSVCFGAHLEFLT